MAELIEIKVLYEGKEVSAKINEDKLIKTVTDTFSADKIFRKMTYSEIEVFAGKYLDFSHIMHYVDNDEIVNALAKKNILKETTIEELITDFNLSNFDSLPVMVHTKLVTLLKQLEKGDYSAIDKIEV